MLVLGLSRTERLRIMAADGSVIFVTINGNRHVGVDAGPEVRIRREHNPDHAKLRWRGDEEVWPKEESQE